VTSLNIPGVLNARPALFDVQASLFERMRSQTANAPHVELL
jgi:hypothetical protein